MFGKLLYNCIIYDEINKSYAVKKERDYEIKPDLVVDMGFKSLFTLEDSNIPSNERNMS